MAISGTTPLLDLQTGNVNLGNNSAVNISKGNTALAGAVGEGLPGGFSNGVYNLGNNNLGVASGVLSNVLQVGDDNDGLAAGLAAQDLVIGSRNFTTARETWSRR